MSTSDGCPCEFCEDSSSYLSEFDSFLGEAETIPTKSFVQPAEQVWRPEEAREIAAQLLRPHPPVIAISGKLGSGRTSLIAEVATTLRDGGHQLPLRLIDEEPANRIQALGTGLANNRSSTRPVIVIDDFDLASKTAEGKMLPGMVIKAWRADLASFLIVMSDDRYAEVADYCPEFKQSLHRVALPEFPESQLRGIVEKAAQTLAAEAQVCLGDEIIEASLAPAPSSSGRAHPGLAISRIDAAIGQARLRNRTTLRLEDFGKEAVRPIPKTAAMLQARLNERVLGQTAAVETVARRLAPAMLDLRLRPERPLAVFLFAGPTGVGKTELAKQIATVVFGSPRELIRLDMSEYAGVRGDDALMKLIGCHRSWKNSSTEGLLTTRILDKPNCVLLLDEFEKCSEVIWPLFLQVFDEGRLTDGWGNTAFFNKTIIIMTSNLGVREANARRFGFGTDETSGSAKQMTAISNTLPPEFLNRITETVTFGPLTKDAIRDLAARELAEATARFAKSGWRVEYGPDVPAWLAETGYDPAMGARHLQRNIEREVMFGLAELPTRHAKITAGQEGLAFACGG